MKAIVKSKKKKDILRLSKTQYMKDHFIYSLIVEKSLHSLVINYNSKQEFGIVT